MGQKETTYTAAFEELQMIVRDIESGDIGVDELSEKVKRASVLIAICKEKLFKTEDDVNQILKELESE
jgi:exodeoxyribonuclease VII small subunit